MPRPAIGPIVQIAYVVEDLDAAIAHWTHKLGVGPFYVIRHQEYETVTHRGSLTSPDVSLAFAHSGDLNVELIQQHNDASSVFDDFIKAYGYGLQHLGVFSEDIEADTGALAAAGIAELQRGLSKTGAETRFYDTEFHPGAMLELLKDGSRIREFFEILRRAAANWDGVTPTLS
jgi:4-hydroxyphenylpyruvate dioxygenase-like putative hemolysin